ncbi:LysR family transcriptional regulator [Maritalea sp. S77]|uniref:LysR family transcriptional regulator n=1 Tax=Maritalea sp. S77 TaxID=3415125 RepID=UPI003C7AE42D
MFDNLALFLRIVERGGLSAAGRDFGLAPATVSERLAALEAHYGATLLIRTTRSISLTDEGRLVVDGARRLLSEAEDLKAQVRHGVEKISGLIRLSAPSDLGRVRIVPLLEAFQAQHPEVSVDLTLGDGYLDLVGLGTDLAVRYGVLPDSSLIAHRLATSRRILCASPTYLNRNGVPKTPQDLLHHKCLIMRFGENVAHEWTFGKDGNTETVTVRGHRTTNDGSIVREWCLKGHGIAFKSRLDIYDELKTGTLVPLLADYDSPDIPLQIVYPGNRILPRRVRRLIEHLDEAFRGIK